MAHLSGWPLHAGNRISVLGSTLVACWGVTGRFPGDEDVFMELALKSLKGSLTCVGLGLAAFETDDC